MQVLFQVTDRRVQSPPFDCEREPPDENTHKAHEPVVGRRPLIKSLPMMCCFAAQDLDLMEIYLSKDAADFHRHQVSELAIETPGGEA